MYDLTPLSPGRVLHRRWLDVGYWGKGWQWIEQEIGWEAEIVKHTWTGLRGLWVPKGTQVN